LRTIRGRVSPVDNSKDARSKWGMSRTMISNIWTGVKDGYERKLEINGVGYRAAMQGKNLQLALGFSHDVVYQPPEGVNIACPKPTEIVITGIDKQVLGQVAPRSAATAVPNPTRARASSMLKSGLSAKKARRSKEDAKWLAGNNPLRVGPTVFAARSRRWPTAVRACRFIARRRTSMRKSSTTAGRTLAAASTLDTGLRPTSRPVPMSAAAAAVGKLVAERASEGRRQGSRLRPRRFIYHGRIKALAEAAREGGLSF
jgi:large subunit ribosomal protein L6